MKKSAVLLLVMTTLLSAEEKNLDKLLIEYREAGELYKETKEDNSGHVIVFSRADLDRMQAYTLNDVLKTIRLFTLKNTKMGMSTLVKSPYSEATMSSVKLFINSHELKSITAGTATVQYGKMGLNFIDHIEIYQASNSIAFGGEPGNMTIRMYTKDPTRENASVLQTSLDSKGGNRAQFIEANRFEDYSYLANIDIGKNKYDSFTTANGSHLSRDSNRAQTYVSLQKEDNFLLELGAGKENSDPFAGFGSSISGGYFNSELINLNFTKYFQNDLRFIFGTSYENVKIQNSDKLGIMLQNGKKAYDFFIENGSKTYNATVEKRAVYGDNRMLLGMEARHKEFYLNDFKSNDLDFPVVLGAKNLDVYMFYMENEYTINSDNSITLGAKLDHYRNHMGNSSTEKLLRFAYGTNLNQNLSVKLFAQKNYTYPIFAQTAFTPLYYPNPNLEASHGNILKIESEYTKDALTLTLGFGGAKSNNGIVYNKAANTYVNNPDNADFSQIFFGTKYKFDDDNKIVTEYFIADKDKYHFSSDKGAVVQLFNRVGKVDLYNELVYRSSYRDLAGYEIDAGFDYTSGAIYRYSKHLDFKLKGENIFDKASMSNISGIYTSAIEPRAIFTLEYTF